MNRTINDSQIKNLAKEYREAIVCAQDNDLFAKDFRFYKFPRGCCGDVSYLLAEYLQRNGIETLWYSGKQGDWSHAWLVVKDYRVKKPSLRTFACSEEISIEIAGDIETWIDKKTDIIEYEANDLQGGLIIDITADQFENYDIPVYVGCIDTFHKAFEFKQAHNYDGLVDDRLVKLYQIIESCL